MAETRDELQALLKTLGDQMPVLVREHPDDGDFWANFAGASDFILDAAGPDDFDWVLEQINALLIANGKPTEDLAPTDDLDHCSDPPKR
ncbi:MAG: hypothetical protein BGO50_01760 [Rhodanobacter sp. 67-28]|nr:MAG: hypothetical protein BGO50_01760 [Rhodanobacter sp. 67-28]